MKTDTKIKLVGYLMILLGILGVLHILATKKAMWIPAVWIVLGIGILIKNNIARIILLVVSTIILVVCALGAVACIVGSLVSFFNGKGINNENFFAHLFAFLFVAFLPAFFARFLTRKEVKEQFK